MAKRKKSSPHRGGKVNRLKEEFALRVRIRDALLHEGFLSPEAADEAAFHMTDWLAELQALVRLYRSRTWDPDGAADVLRDFVSHAPHHLAAAHLIVMGLPVTDVFELGAVEGTGRGKRELGEPYPEIAKRTKRKTRSSRATP